MPQILRLIRGITHHISPSSPTFSTIHRPQNQIVYDYLINNFNFPKSKALTYSNIFAKVQNLEKPESVVSYFKSLGLTDAQIISSAKKQPTILFANINKTLRPKIQFFQELGFSGPDLGEFISKTSPLLGQSLDARLKPTIQTIKNIFVKHNVKDVNHHLFLVLKRCLFPPHKKLLANVSYLESYGVSGSQLLRALAASTILMSSETNLQRHVSRALDLGFSVDSKMFVHGLIAISGISTKTFLKKFKLLKSFGFTDSECKEVVRGAPKILLSSEDKLSFGLGFYLETVGLEKSALIDNPVCLMFDMRNRVVPRYKVVNLMKSKGILEKENRFTYVVMMSEEKFLEKYISRFPDHGEDLWDAYKGHLVDSSGLKQQMLK